MKAGMTRMYGRTIFSCLSDSAVVAYTIDADQEWPRDAFFITLQNGQLWIDLGEGKRMSAEDWRDSAMKVWELHLRPLQSEDTKRDNILREVFDALPEVPGSK